MDKHPWKIYDPAVKPSKAKVKLPPPPPWRQPGAAGRAVIAKTFQAAPEIVNAVNVALHLRRPLLVTGEPGTGKSSLVYSVAQRLGLGEVLVWAINSRSTLSDALYRYDALARLQQIQARNVAGTKRGEPVVDEGTELGQFITLGPLGSALAAADAPRALLIDEIDKSDVDLPNDLLSVLDTGSFPIAELQRVADRFQDVTVRSAVGQVRVAEGEVSFTEYPFIVMTSNGERDFPAAFLRRCVQCRMPDPDNELFDIVRAHLPKLAKDPKLGELIETFKSGREQGGLATDQLLNAQYLAPLRESLTKDERDDMLAVLFKSLTG
ncbi:AAA family ATPase [Aquincola sp. S2]|uniref:AAA family ATPase n=1 Tax=Pseudaquabacterium terrae TaxID=2732868 RepID=A0ABX2EUL1_9BURK|nr:AAA family ATPase [Aquabacterium terrae]NRF72278.1 AAA family ATPase [Aquabacterium terrae]